LPKKEENSRSYTYQPYQYPKSVVRWAFQN